LLDAGYRGRISDTVGFALQNRVVLLTAPNGVPVDISPAGLPFEENAICRATLFEYAPGCALRTCSAEDLVVFKLFAFRSQDLADVESVVSLRGDSLDWRYIEDNLSPLAEAKEDPAIMQALTRFRG
jgi:hypothetical protein